MIEMIINNPLLVGLLLVTLLIGVTLGLCIVAVTFLIHSRERTPKDQGTSTPRRLVSPRRYRKDSEQRAALFARMMVASGTIQTPTRR